MKLARVLTSLALGSVAMLSTSQPVSAESYGYQVGNRFPEVVLPSLDDGTPLSLTTFRGRKLILHIWASW